MRNLFLIIIYKVIVPFILKPLTGIQYKHKEVLQESKQFVIIANHNSHLDTLALMSAMPHNHLMEIAPVAAGDYFGSGKLKSFFTRLLTNALIIPRCNDQKSNTKDAFRMMLKALRRGKSLIIYPEGSRGKAGEMQEFKNGIGHILMRYPHIAYIPAYIENTGKVLPKNTLVPMPYNCRITFGQLQYGKGADAKEIVANMFSEVCMLKSA